jgi:hypothetical protein
MKKRIAIVLLILVAFGFVSLLLLKIAGSKPPRRLAFHFHAFTNTGRRDEALFTISNHPGVLSIHGAARIETKMPAGWVCESSTNVNTALYAGPFVGVPLKNTNVPARIVMDVQEATPGLRGIIEDLKERFFDIDHEMNGPRYFLTNEIGL